MRKVNTRLFSGINRASDVTTCSPDSFRFHGPMKAMWYMVLKLINPPPKEWLNNVKGNSEVLRDIYYEYLEVEGQKRRLEVNEKGIPFLLCLMEDPNWEEFANWYLYRVIQEFKKGRFIFHPRQVYPRCWFRDDRPYRAIATKEEILALRAEFPDHVVQPGDEVRC